MSPLVKVLVLPVQISSTDPITSGEFRFLTKILSSFILITEYAREIPTVKGRPSGTATIMRVIVKVIDLKKASIVKSSKIPLSEATIVIICLTRDAMKIRMAAYSPVLVKIPAKLANLLYNGVFVDVSSFSSTTPLLLKGPTQQTTALPTPETIRD
jgi:hypothetical protein